MRSLFFFLVGEILEIFLTIFCAFPIIPRNHTSNTISIKPHEIIESSQTPSSTQNEKLNFKSIMILKVFIQKKYYVYITRFNSFLQKFHEHKRKNPRQIPRPDPKEVTDSRPELRQQYSLHDPQRHRNYRAEIPAAKISKTIWYV